MANDFVNTITTSNGTTYDVQDKRLTVTAADAGKVVSVDSNGNLSLTTPNGGTKLYKHVVSVGQNYEEYAFEFISTDATAYTSSTFNYSGLNGKIIAFIPKGYAGGSKYIITLAQKTGATGDIIFIDYSNSTISNYSLSSVNVRSATVTEL